MIRVPLFKTVPKFSISSACLYPKRAPAFRQVDHLLTMNSEQLNQPLDHVASLFEEIEAILRFRLGFKRNAPP
jgi:hypothetical protein